MRGENVGFLDALQVDGLVGGHVRQGAEPVAIARRIFELECIGGFVHQPLVHLAHVLAFAFEETARLIDQLPVVLDADFTSARGGTPLDLIEQAGACAAVISTVGARSQQEGALQHVDRACHRACRGKRAEVISFAAPRATMFEDLRGGVIAGDENIGKRLVVPHQHVEAWPEALDEVGF